MAQRTKTKKTTEARPQKKRTGSLDHTATLPDVLQKIRSEREQEPRGFFCEISDLFRRVAAATARAMGSAWTFAAAVLLVVGWAATGPIFNYSETWQLVINTGTTIITFLMIFLVQNSQNRDSRAIQLKLDELLRGVKGARTAMVDLEDATDEELEKLQREFEKLRKTPGDSVDDETEE